MAWKRRYSNQIHLISQTIFKAIIYEGKTRFNYSLDWTRKQSAVYSRQSAICNLLTVYCILPIALKFVTWKIAAKQI